MPDYRSPEAASWRHLYNSKAWRAFRNSILIRDLFTCQMCGRLEGNSSQLVADHKLPHKGNRDLFWDAANIQTVCKPCHDRHKQSEERTGFSKAIGIDGWPTDDRHPANGGKPAKTNGLGPISHPSWFRPVFVPLTIVCGAPASGKTRYVAEHKGQRDVVYDLDVIAQELFKRALPYLDTDQRIKCLKQRNDRLSDLMWSKAAGTYDRAWLIVSEPIAHKRQWWADTLKPEQIVVMETPASVCMARAKADKSQARAANVDHAIKTWWTTYTRRADDLIVTP